MLELVSTLQGTDSRHELSKGNTLPLVGPPWPMLQWAPQTSTGDHHHETGWWFQYRGTHCCGFRATRQPSPWMGDYGQFLIMPQVGDVRTSKLARQLAYDVKASTFKPDYCRLDFWGVDINAELTASERCAVMRFRFNGHPSGRLIIDPFKLSHIEVEGRTIRGYTTANSGGVSKNWKAYFVIKLDRDVTAFGTFDGDKTSANAKTADGEKIGAYVEFSTKDQPTIEVLVGTSYLSYEQAERNLAAETAGGFDGVRERTAAEWTKQLDRIRIKGGSDSDRRTFYSCLYRAMTFPHPFHEFDAGGKPVHFSVYTDKPEAGELYTDVGFWDVYRTNFPFWAIAYPEKLEKMLGGFVQAYRESGWFPQWPSPGHRVCMIGTHIDAVFADAVVKGIGGFDLKEAYEGIRKNAFETPPNETVGRVGFDDYVRLGYVAASDRAWYTASCSLDYAYNDWCVAQVAKAVGGKEADIKLLTERSKNYAKLWDAEVGFFRPKSKDGKWFGTFDEYAWSAGYVEGGAWQCSWAVQHDVEGLAKLMGGKEKLAAKIDQMMGTAPIFRYGEYGGLIHEMTEMAVVPFGQYAHSNQPVHHVLYLYAAVGQPWKTQYWTRRVCREMYGPGPDGFPGDEDNGEMAAWYLLSATGLYSLCVGDPNYTLTSPAFDEISIAVKDGKRFTVRAINNGPTNVYVQRRTFNGKPHTSETISHADVANGGVLEVELGPRVPDVAKR